jgi:hypothetical protein
MRTFALAALCGLFLCVFDANAQSSKCATPELLKQAMAAHPEKIADWIHYKEHLQQADAQYQQQIQKGPKLKTTTIVTIPVVFHVILTSTELTQLGGVNGVRDRVIQTIQVLNQDYSKTNPDITQVPAAFVPNEGASQIRFGPAHRTATGSATEGFEIKITTVSGFSATTNNGSDCKHVSSGGLDAWDPTKYFNIWVVDVLENGILGYTIPPSYVVNWGYPASEKGCVLDYGTFGKRGGTTTFFSPPTNDLGRTATHEVGHFFELEHNFGEGPGCPGVSDIDDGISDTPPQDVAIFSNPPGTCPVFPKFDACTPSGNGIMWMNFMDYTDDICMHMFTNGQVSRMELQVAPSGKSYSLTLHPELLDWPTGINEPNLQAFDIFPNPTSGNFQVSIIKAADLKNIEVVNTIGQAVYSVEANNTINNYNIDLTNFSKGVYYVRCTFVTGTATKKIIVQ